MAIDWGQVRGEFPALADWTYLNTATYGQTPRCGVEAAERHFARRNTLACADFLEWFDDADRIRGGIARMIGCEAGDIAFFGNASSALSLLLGGMDWRAGDRVVTLEHEFPNNLYYPSLLGGRGVEFVETAWDGFYDAVTERTRLVLLSSVNYTTGFRPPLDEVSKFLRGRGVMLYVDGTQSVGALRMNVGELRPAMMAVNAYKWMLSPNGAGFAYVAPELRERLQPNVVGWRSHHEWRRVDSLHRGAPLFSGKAEKYEGGMLNFPSLYAMGAVVEMMEELGGAGIEARVMETAEALREVLRGQGGRLLCDAAPHYDSQIVTARWEGRDASEIARELKKERVLVSARHGNLRVSVHFYNDRADLERLGEALGELVGGTRLRRGS
ncbi:MAG: aminotransferase class V-fold PLP-dependent enzyme [Acidobacteriia bacterium]|nr:aminotransferase class V-fold PLP-dependent enzyme [Terriglobia bacterium]